MSEVKLNGKFYTKIIKGIEYFVYCEYEFGGFNKFPIFYYKQKISKMTDIEFEQYCIKRITTPKKQRQPRPRKFKPEGCRVIFMRDKSYVFLPFYSWLINVLGYDPYEQESLHFGYIGNECNCFAYGGIIDYEGSVAGFFIDGELSINLPKYEFDEFEKDEKECGTFRIEYIKTILNLLIGCGLNIDDKQMIKIEKSLVEEYL